MKLYHYSKERFSRLETKGYQETGHGSKGLSFTNLPYNCHISFFTEPLSLGVVSAAFNGEHAFWKPGAVLYRHEVNVKDCFPGIFKIVESEEITNYYYDDSIDLDAAAWDEFVLKNLVKLGYIGKKEVELNRAIDKLKGATDRAYRKLPERPNYESLKGKYAATVPHVMLYPENGYVNVSSSMKVTIPKFSKEIYHKW